jgi:DNA-binding MarR family transcriptional regulator
MDETRHTPAGAALTELVLTVFRVNGRLLDAGDRMTKGLGLTSARWQVMGALADGPLTAAQIARDMGLQRQSVQRLVDLLGEEGVVEFAPNPNHRRAKLVRMTDAGRRAYDRLGRIQARWANELARGTSTQRLRDAATLLQHIAQRLGDAQEG